jgi:transcriptional regulator GlxA family with amidase domain
VATAPWPGSSGSRPNPSAGLAQIARVPETTIAIAVWDGVEELDFVGPYEVLTAWVAATERDARVVIVAEGDGIVRCAHGLRVVPDVTWSELERPDVIVMPGGGTAPLLDDRPLLERLRRHADDGALMTSVCTGSLVYAQAGLLDGKQATTHWGAVERLGQFDGIDVRADDRFVDAGNVITAQGVSAGIDMALYLVKRLDSDESAARIRRYIQYDPQPPV